MSSVVTYFPGRGTLIEKTYLEAEAKSLLLVLEARGLPISDDVRERITTCTDYRLLESWITRAVKVTHAEDLFTEDPEGAADTPDRT